MRRIHLFTPSELRLAVLLFILAVLSRGAALLERESPEVAAWIAALEPGTFLPPSADSLSFAAGSPRRSKPELPPRGSVDPNQASAEELGALPGIGPALAARIVASRESDGPFGSAEALCRVKGIGPATLSKLRPYLTLP